MWKFFNNISINYLKVDTTEGCPIGPGSTLQKEVQLVCIRYHRQCSVTKTPQHILRKHTSSTFWAHEQACPTPTSFYSSILPNTINSSKIVFCATFSPPLFNDSLFQVLLSPTARRNLRPGVGRRLMMMMMMKMKKRLGIAMRMRKMQIFMPGVEPDPCSLYFLARTTFVLVILARGQKSL